MNRRAWLARGLLPLASYLTTGCSTPVRQSLPNGAALKIWTGRLGVNVASEPPQSFSASFELKGNASDGELVLVSPIGNTLATMHWSPGSATLRTAQAVQEYDSMDTLTRQVVGTSLPIRALFDWLDGIHTTAAGWKVELDRLQQGRVLATRSEPSPAAELRLILDH